MKEKSMEDYLRTAYSLYEQEGNNTQGVKSIDLAKELKISKPSVSEMIRKLVEKGFVTAKPYSNIFFTDKGLKEAKRVMHNHRVIEVFLKDLLRYDSSKVHEEAHRLEHAFSEESIKRLDKFLKHPKKSPLGKPIPHQER